MKREYIESEHIIERYIRNELSETEAEQFEQRLLWDIELQQQYELTAKLREGMRDLAAAKPDPTPQRRWSLLASPAYAAAATVLLGVTTIGWLMSALTPGGGGVQVASSRVFSLEAVRSASLDDLPVVNPGADDEWLTLLTYPDLDSAESFRAELARMPGPPDVDGANWQTVWQGAPTASGDGDTVAVTLRGGLLKPGAHRLQIVSADRDRGGVLGEVYFQVE